jgi:hypothetical protein
LSKLIFLPFRFSAGILAGVVGKKILERLWTPIDDQESPQAENRGIGILQLALTSWLFRVVRALADRGSRRAFARLVGL